MQMLRRTFRALKPRRATIRGETTINLYFTPDLGVRIFTSIGAGQDKSAEAGADAIRVVFYNFSKDRPLIPGKAPIVKRTQNWRNALQERIEDYLELYHEKMEYWDSRTV